MSIRTQLKSIYNTFYYKRNLLIEKKISARKKKDSLAPLSDKIIQLNDHTQVRGLNLMETFQNRKSTRSFEAKSLSLQDLSDLLWAANGINRAHSGERTAASAMNSQDVDIYVCRQDGAYLYDAALKCLKQATEQDIRPLLEGHHPTGSPIILLLVSDMSRYTDYQPEDKASSKRFYEMGILDAGIVSQNIGIFCAGTGLATVPRIGMDNASIRIALNLKDTQKTWLNHPVGYPKV